MPKGRKAAKRTRHDTRKWILKALASAGAGEALPTSQIEKSIASLSGSRIPSYSVYQALRTLTKRKVVSARRKGRELSFSLVATGRAAPAPAVVERPAEMAAPPMPPAPAPTPSTPAGLHTIAPGEVTILHVGDSHIETATNVHGKIVLEKHRRPVHATSPAAT